MFTVLSEYTRTEISGNDGPFQAINGSLAYVANTLPGWSLLRAECWF
jgi:hypothetical protein